MPQPAQCRLDQGERLVTSHALDRLVAHRHRQLQEVTGACRRRPSPSSCARGAKRLCLLWPQNSQRGRRTRNLCKCRNRLPRDATQGQRHPGRRAVRVAAPTRPSLAQGDRAPREASVSTPRSRLRARRSRRRRIPASSGSTRSGEKQRDAIGDERRQVRKREQVTRHGQRIEPGVRLAPGDREGGNALRREDVPGQQ